MKFLLFTFVTLSSVVAGWGQNGDIRAVIEYRVKTDRLADFVDLQKQYAAELKKSNSPRSRYVFQLLTGPRAYISVSYYTKWAELDEPLTPNPAIAGLVARMYSCVESSERRIDLIDPAMGIRETSAIPNFVQVVRLSVKADKVNDYLALSKSVSLPAYKKAGVKRRIFARVRLGGPSTDFLTSVGMDKWADLDGPNPLVKGLGEQGYQAYLAKLTPLIYRSQFDMYRYLADSSYVKE